MRATTYCGFSLCDDLTLVQKLRRLGLLLVKSDKSQHTLNPGRWGLSPAERLRGGYRYALPNGGQRPGISIVIEICASPSTFSLMSSALNVAIEMHALPRAAIYFVPLRVITQYGTKNNSNWDCSE